MMKRVKTEFSVRLEYHLRVILWSHMLRNNLEGILALSCSTKLLTESSEVLRIAVYS